MDRATKRELFHNINIAVEILRDSEELLNDEVDAPCKYCIEQGKTCPQCMSYCNATNHIADAINCLEKSFGLCEIIIED